MELSDSVKKLTGTRQTENIIRQTRSSIRIFVEFVLGCVSSEEQEKYVRTDPSLPTISEGTGREKPVMRMIFAPFPC